MRRNDVGVLHRAVGGPKADREPRARGYSHGEHKVVPLPDPRRVDLRCNLVDLLLLGCGTALRASRGASSGQRERSGRDRCGDVCVARDDVAERGALDLLELIRGQPGAVGRDILVPQAVSSAHPHELLDDRLLGELPNRDPRYRLLRQHPGERVQLRDIPVEVGQDPPRAGVGREVVERCDGGQIVGGAHLVVCGRLVVSTTLQVACWQVTGGQARGREHEAAKIVHNLQVDLLRSRRHGARQHRVDQLVLRRGEERRAKRQLAHQAVLVAQLDACGQCRVAVAEGDGREEVVDARVDARVVPAVRLDGAHELGQEVVKRNVLQERDDTQARSR
eukprot:405308-Prymnesium_polylepis.2